MQKRRPRPWQPHDENRLPDRLGRDFRMATTILNKPQSVAQQTQHVMAHRQTTDERQVRFGVEGVQQNAKGFIEPWITEFSESRLPTRRFQDLLATHPDQRAPHATPPHSNRVDPSKEAPGIRPFGPRPAFSWMFSREASFH